jgi:hypothetical protein
MHWHLRIELAVVVNIDYKLANNTASGLISLEGAEYLGYLQWRVS